MRFSVIFFTSILIHFSAFAYSQLVDLKVYNERIPKVLREIQKQTRYDFVFKSTLFKENARVTISKKRVQVDEILDEIIPLNLEYQIVDQTIVIRERKTKTGSRERTIVRGKVVDEEGLGIPGVTIRIQGTQAGVVTDIDGMYSISIPEGYTTLIYSSLGFETQTVPINDQTIIDIKMKPEVSQLGEVVVNGYFVTDKESYTGTTTTVTGEELISMGGASLMDNISLIAPTVQILQNNALGSNPNAIPEIRVRGESVLNTNLSSSSLLGDPNLPLFILDNFPVDIQRVIDLDQTRIESINVLIDAASTAIYGSRAANGVIVIKTKQPEAGKLQVTFNARTDVDFADVESYDLLTGKELFELQSKLGMRQYRGFAGSETREIEKLIAAGVETDWLAQPVRNTFGQRYTLNLQGGTDEIRYSIDGSYLSRPGVMKGSGRDTYGAVMRLIYNPTDRLTFRNSLETNFNKASESPYGSYEYYARMPGYLPTRNLDGTMTQEYTYANEGRGTEQSGISVFEQGNGKAFYNPLFEKELGNFERSEYVNFINNFELVWDINDYFRFQTNISYTNQSDISEQFVSPFSILNDTAENDVQEFSEIDIDITFGNENGDNQDGENSSLLNTNGRYSYSITETSTVTTNAILTYSRDFSGHVVTANLGSTVEEKTAERVGFTAVGYSSSNYDPAFASGYESSGLPDSQEETRRFLSGFGKFSYNYKGRYLTDFSYNISGNSSSGSTNRFAPFWSIGTGWNLHNEDFIPKNLINTLRITANYGHTGSIEFSSYQALATSRFHTEMRYLGNIGTFLRGLGNEDLRWQTQKEINFGINFGILNNRLSGQGALYRRRTYDVVTTVDAPPSLGFSSFVDNLGIIENEGFELNLRGLIWERKDLEVYLNFSAQANKERILSIGDAFDSFNANAGRAGLTEEQYAEAVENNGFYTTIDEDGSISTSEINLAKLAQGFLVRYEEGGSDEDIYVAQSLGIDPMTGQEFFLTSEGFATTSYSQAAIVKAGNTIPDVRGTFGASVRYKQINLQATFRYEYGAQALNNTLIDNVENSDKYGNVDRRVLTQGWFAPGDVVPFKSNIEVNDGLVRQNFTNPSTRFVQDNNLIELSSLNVTYDLNPSFVRKHKMNSVQLTFNMNNIFYWSTVRLERGTQYPFARSFTTGLRIGL